MQSQSASPLPYIVFPFIATYLIEQLLGVPSTPWTSFVLMLCTLSFRYAWPYPLLMDKIFMVLDSSAADPKTVLFSWEDFGYLWLHPSIF